MDVGFFVPLRVICVQLRLMINRTLVRTKVVQTLFAYYKDSSSTPEQARKMLLGSFDDTYSLYIMLLDFADELTTYAEEQLQEAIVRSSVTHTPFEPNRRFVNNKIAQQVFNNRRIRNYMDKNNLRWDAGMQVVSSVYKQLTESTFYQEFMTKESPSYDDEKLLWRKIYSTLLLNDENLLPSLEELEVVLDSQGWTTDVDVVMTYVVKTIKRFKEELGDEQPLLEEFDSEEELSFAKDLLHLTIEHADEYRPLIAESLKNWEAERVAYMDNIIMLVALTEIMNFNNIALEVSMSEYIEIAKEYSSSKSHIFINGVLNKIVMDMKQQNKLFKVVR